jgi:hypothetical protein
MGNRVREAVYVSDASARAYWESWSGTSVSIDKRDRVRLNPVGIAQTIAGTSWDPPTLSLTIRGVPDHPIAPLALSSLA